MKKREQRERPEEPAEAMRDYAGRTMDIVLEIPADAYHLDITCKTVDDSGETRIYTTRLGLEDIRRARKDFLEAAKEECTIVAVTE